MRSVTASLFLLLITTGALGQQNTTILGPSNVALQDGADALRSGDAKEGIRLTQLGLSQATSSQQRETGKSNLCAGYAMLGQYELGLPFCDEVLEQNGRNWRARSNRALIYIKLRRFAEANEDLLVGEDVSPNASTLQAVRKMYLDATDPVAPSVIVDDRRDPVREETAADEGIKEDD
ncbi:MAG: hypothetical protein ACR2QL_02405 [Woeseiaceae bacterium]